MPGKTTKKDRKYLEEFAANHTPRVETIGGNNVSWQRALTNKIAGAVEAGIQDRNPAYIYPAAALATGAIMKPAQLFNSLLGGEVVDKISKKFTGKNFGDAVSKALDINPEVASILNPGYLFGGLRGKIKGSRLGSKPKVATENIPNAEFEVIDRILPKNNGIARVQGNTTNTKLLAGNQVGNYPGYQLNMLMSGSPLEKQLSKTGQISVSNVKALAKKENAVSQAVIENVLNKHFAGLKNISYNQLKQQVQKELIEYDTKPDKKWEDYGANRLGFDISGKTRDTRKALRDMSIPLPDNIRNDNWFKNRFTVLTDVERKRSLGMEPHVDDGTYRSFLDRETGDFIDTKDLYPLLVNRGLIEDNPSLKFNTYTFSDYRIPHGDSNHYHNNTLGHSRTYTLPNEPNTLYVMESQSDWGQHPLEKGSYLSFDVDINGNTNYDFNNNGDIVYVGKGKGMKGRDFMSAREENLSNRGKELKKQLENLYKLNPDLDLLFTSVTPFIGGENGLYPSIFNDMPTVEPREAYPELYRYATGLSDALDNEYRLSAENMLSPKNLLFRDINNSSIPAQAKYLHDNYTTRQIQENLKYAAQHGQTTMRYPTAQTAAKIEGYQANERSSAYNTLLDERNRLLSAQRDGIPDEVNLFSDEPIYYTDERRKKELADIDKQINDLVASGKHLEYSPEYKTILKKYSDFPKQFTKLYKNADVREVSDALGNTWYEVDVPTNYLNREWKYKLGGNLSDTRPLKPFGGTLGKPIKPTKPKKVDLSRINLKAMYDNNRTYGGDRYIDTTMLRTIDNYLINNNVHLPQRQAIAYTVQQEGNTTKDHGNGAAGLTGWRGTRAVGLPKTLQGQMNKLYTELYGPFNGDNWNHGGKSSGYNSAREAQEAFKNAVTLEDALRALNYGYVRPPREDILYRIQNGSKAFTRTKRLGGSNRYSFKNGGKTNKNYYDTMQKVAEDNYKAWGFNSPEEAYIYALNDNTYNYKGYYTKYPNGKGNAIDHWTDEFKTVYHPTFSNESRYSGKKSQYNPAGLVGGWWEGNTFRPQLWQMIERDKRRSGGPIGRFIKVPDDIASRVSNLYNYAKTYLKTKLSGTGDGTFIDLSNQNVSRIKNNTKGVKLILTNEFVEHNNNTIRKKKDFINTNDTLLGDKAIPLSNISTFYGIENGKLKAGPLSTFDNETLVVPNRTKSTPKLKKIIIPSAGAIRNQSELEDSIINAYNVSHGYKQGTFYDIANTIFPWTNPLSPKRVLFNNEGRGAITRVLNENPTKIDYFRKAITEQGDTIPLPFINASPKVLFADETGNAAFVSNFGNPDNITKLNAFLDKNPSYPIMVDNGRYSSYMTTLPNVSIYSGLNSPDSMFIIGTTDTNKRSNGGRIHIKPENRGKFNATKARTGKTTEELTHSKNPITRKRAIFAQNAAKWNKK